MDKAIGAILGLILVIAVIYFVVIVVCYVVAAILIAAALIGPHVLAGYGLRNRLRRFRLSDRKIWECLALGLALFAFPWLTVVADSSFWPMALWTGLLLGIAGPATFVAIEGYRQVFWPHRKAAAMERQASRRLRSSISHRQRQLSGLEAAIRAEDARHGQLRQELGQLRTQARALVLRTDPAFYSAEVTRWTHACATMPETTLQQRAIALPAVGVVAALNQVLAYPPQMLRDQPAQVRAGLQAAVIRAEVITRTLGGPADNYEQNVGQARRLRQEIESLTHSIESSQNKRRVAHETIRQLGRQQTAIR